MFTNDEDDFLMGSPRSKFFDIVYNANRSLAEQSIENVFDRYCAMELLLEELVKDENELEFRLNEIIFNKTDKMLQRKNSLFITATGDVLTQHE
ncbi:MAG: DUF2018 family protein [Epsilonproteobacteria bacterium]|nr:DUF2018 family protein [Campylobacterota bacterium]